MNVKDLKVAIYADGADIDAMKKEYKKGVVTGFTTNPSLMKKAGVQSYSDFSKDVLKEITDLPISMEVFADDFVTMETEAREIASWGENVYVKIPVTNAKGETSVPLIQKLSADGLKLNVTAIFTLEQTKEVVEALKPGTDNIVSLFAGRIADAGIDPEVVLKQAVDLCKAKPGVKVLWASCREVFNIIQADRIGVDIITVPNDILAKIDLIGKDLNAYSLETVQMFLKDSTSLGFSIL